MWLLHISSVTKVPIDNQLNLQLSDGIKTKHLVNNLTQILILKNK